MNTTEFEDLVGALLCCKASPFVAPFRSRGPSLVKVPFGLAHPVLGPIRH
ncbi:MAG TPA: hypothetical protein VFA81_02740 [Burkholderiales bacterium]|nr:hypothetical protein [Burkholderiales bacterium]